MLFNKMDNFNFSIDQFDEPIAKGKTKAVVASKIDSSIVLIESYNSITAFNAKRKNELTGKAVTSTKTTCNVFKFLNYVGCKTHFIKQLNEKSFIAKRCEMIPIEWVARRVATGSFLKRNPGVKEGEIFFKPKIETFYKNDEKDDPQWSDEQILAEKFQFCDGKRKIGRNEIALMKRWTSTIFKVLEKAWKVHNCVLVDMKIEFGVDVTGNILLADVIDNDSWRLWPNGDRKLQLDKQVYRDLDNVTETALFEVSKNYEKVAKITEIFCKQISNLTSRIVIVMGSEKDLSFSNNIKRKALKLGVDDVVIRICSAHKSTAEVLDLIDEYEDNSTVFIAVAGRSNGLGPVISANSTLPVINAPPLLGEWADKDIWSSIRMPSGIGCTTVFGEGEAALAAAKILSLSNYIIYSKILVVQTDAVAQILEADNKAN